MLSNIEIGTILKCDGKQFQCSLVGAAFVEILLSNWVDRAHVFQYTSKAQSTFDFTSSAVLYLRSETDICIDYFHCSMRKFKLLNTLKWNSWFNLTRLIDENLPFVKLLFFILLWMDINLKYHFVDFWLTSVRRIFGDFFRIKRSSIFEFTVIYS